MARSSRRRDTPGTIRHSFVFVSMVQFSRRGPNVDVEPPVFASDKESSDRYSLVTTRFSTLSELQLSSTVFGNVCF